MDTRVHRPSGARRGDGQPSGAWGGHGIRGRGRHTADPATVAPHPHGDWRL